MRRLIRITVTIAGMLTMQAAVADPAKQHQMGWNDCKGLQLQIFVRPDLVEKIGISKERIESHLRDKLRAERIYVTEALPSGNMLLYIMLKGTVGINTVENREYKNIAYGISASFHKQFPGSDEFIITYVNFEPAYMKDPDPRSIEADVISYGRAAIDNYYLRVNAAACKNSN